MTSTPPALAAWHQLLQTRAVADLSRLIAADAVFHSPVLHTPQRGRALVVMYLTGAFHVLANPSFHYVREVVGAQDAVLEFETVIDGLTVNGVDMIRWNEAGEIVDFKVMLRPLKAIQLVHQKMAELLAQAMPGAGA